MVPWNTASAGTVKVELGQSAKGTEASGFQLKAPYRGMAQWSWGRGRAEPLARITDQHIWALASEGCLCLSQRERVRASMQADIRPAHPCMYLGSGAEMGKSEAWAYAYAILSRS